MPLPPKQQEKSMPALFKRLAYRLPLMVLLLLAQPDFLPAQSVLGERFEQFIRDNVRVAGLIENTTGLAISHGSHFFDTANRFDMNRFTVQPELNVKFRDDLMSFISWRFVKELRYSMESESRKQSVAPARTGTPLTSNSYVEYSARIYRLDVMAELAVIISRTAKAELICV